MKTQITIPCLGYKIAADLYTYDDAKEFLLVIVGLNSSKERNGQFVEKILKGTHQNALVLDLSGHGESPFLLTGVNPAQHSVSFIFKTSPSYASSLSTGRFFY